MSVHDNPLDLYWAVVEPGLRMLSLCRKRGYKVDRQRLQRLTTEFEQRLAVIDAQLHGMLGNINLNSPIELPQAIMALGIDDKDKQPSKKHLIRCTTALFERHLNEHPIFPLLIERSDMKTRLQSFCRPMLRFSERDGFLHPGYNYCGQVRPGEARSTVTMRWSSAAPNTMNPPEWLRACFVSRWPDGLIVTPDWAQLEYRIIVACGNDQALIEQLIGGADPHVAIGNESGLERDQAKNVNYANVYGASLKKTISMGLPADEAAAIMESGKLVMPGALRWMAERKLEAIFNGVVKGLFAVWFPLPDAQLPRDGSKREQKRRAHALRNAVNSPIQSTGGLLCTWAMSPIEAAFRSECLLSIVDGQLHDSIRTDGPASEVERRIEIMREVMTTRAQELCQPWLGRVPLAVDFKVGHTMAGN